MLSLQNAIELWEETFKGAFKGAALEYGSASIKRAGINKIDTIKTAARFLRDWADALEGKSSAPRS